MNGYNFKQTVSFINVSGITVTPKLVFLIKKIQIPEKWNDVMYYVDNLTYLVNYDVKSK